MILTTASYQKGMIIFVTLDVLLLEGYTTLIIVQLPSGRNYVTRGGRKKKKKSKNKIYVSVV